MSLNKDCWTGSRTSVAAKFFSIEQSFIELIGPKFHIYSERSTHWYLALLLIFILRLILKQKAGLQVPCFKALRYSQQHKQEELTHKKGSKSWGQFSRRSLRKHNQPPCRTEEPARAFEDSRANWKSSS